MHPDYEGYGVWVSIRHSHSGLPELVPASGTGALKQTRNDYPPKLTLASRLARESACDIASSIVIVPSL